MYLEQSSLSVESMGRGYAWFDTGTHQSLLDAAHFIHTIEERQGLKVSCIEEIAYTNGWINEEELSYLGEKQAKSAYGEYLLALLSSKKMRV